MAVPAQYVKYYQAAMAKYGVPVSDLEAQDQIESGFNPGAVSPTGARGISQFEPGTATSYGVKFGTDPASVQSQIMGQAAYDAALGFSKDPTRALASYNAGPGNYRAGLGYAADVLAAAKQYGGGVTPEGAPPSLGTPKMVNANFQVQAPSGPNIFNVLAGLESTRQRIAGDSVGPDALQSGWEALGQLFSGQQANQAAETNAQNRVNQVSTLGPQPSGTSTRGGDVNPLQHFTLGRTDMGVDANAPPGTPILAPNTSRVVGITPNWYKGQPYVELEILDGPNAGKVMYVAEQITGIPRVGQVIPRGQAIARYASSGTGIEIGWANPKNPSQTLAQGTTGYSEGQQTQAGKGFLSYLKGLGA